VTDITANDGSWTFLCGTWGSIDGSWSISVNGQEMDHGNQLSQGATIDGGGVLVIGQEQDEPGGLFSAAESFRGQLTRLNFWPRILSSTEILRVMNSCTESAGELISWSDFYPGIHGFVQVSSAASWYFIQGVPQDNSPRDKIRGDQEPNGQRDYKSPRDQEPKGPRAQGTNSIRDQEPKGPRAQGTKSPRDQEPKGPRAQGTKYSRDQEPKGPRAQGTKSPRDQVLKGPRA
jgi:hypothetical protein